MSNESRRKRLTHEALNDFGGGFPAAERVYGALATLPRKLAAAVNRLPARSAPGHRFARGKGDDPLLRGKR